MSQYITRHNCDTKCILGIGSNLAGDFGGLTPIVVAACDEIHAEIGQIVSASRLFSTPSFPPGTGPDYVNAALILSTSLPAEDLLGRLHKIEQRFARVRNRRWSARTLDLDLLDFGGIIQPDLAVWTYWHDLAPEEQARLAPDRLILPHPRIQDRAFVLVPLADIAPDWVHPILGRSVMQMLQDLPADDISAIHALDSPASLALPGAGR
ncbi:2-amino-4-hydroxy-6-hydroxymethyldihydropteridine diphosphokinase [Tropicimonas sp. IMCC34043]|uniref:2-amino-4-hydroxy-6- hydroxymethyldihydropteridine diphosphokinase n=1 Tax=Tropicimonas sp. IMCC34043 TaxID=2248760 RepID=UPI000E286F84|nr:2-amino-4-hydroxy-6-hydroxymethyldihydropteridine diphosphokinase [Tropicimonas sp. IMCC34043]